MTQQIISENNGTWPYGTVDPWPQGLGVFDITDLEWKDRYDASAGPYQTPEMVKQYYASNPRYPSPVLEDTVLRSWFVKGEYMDTPSVSAREEQQRVPSSFNH